MITEEQKYDSNILRNVGFALLAPIGSILFQGIVFNKNVFESHFTVGIIVCVIGILLIYSGRQILKEKN